MPPFEHCFFLTNCIPSDSEWSIFRQLIEAWDSEDELATVLAALGSGVPTSSLKTGRHDSGFERPGHSSSESLTTLVSGAPMTWTETGRRCSRSEAPATLLEEHIAVEAHACDGAEEQIAMPT